MSPTPLIEIQRSQAIIGEIREGDEKQDGKVGKKLSTHRLTSARRELIEEAAGLYGGEVKPWESPTGPKWQVVTERSSLPVLVMPSYSLTQRYEMWEGVTKRTRMCDGIEEELSQGDCICNADGFTGKPCDLYSRLVVMLPELTTLLGWRLVTKSKTAGGQLPQSMEIATAIARGLFVSANLILTQGRSVIDGQTVRYVYPVLDFATGYAALSKELLAGTLAASSEMRALPQGYTPIPPGEVDGVSLEAGLAAAETQTVTRTSRSAAAIPTVDDEIEFGTGPVPVDDPGASSDPLSAVPQSTAEQAAPQVISQAQRRRLFALAREVGMREEHLRDLVEEMTGTPSTKELSVEHYEAIALIVESRKAMV